MLVVNTIEFFSRRISMKIEFRDGPLENLLGGGGAQAKYKKKYSRKRKLNEKNSCMPVNPKKYSCYGLKKFIQRMVRPLVPKGEKSFCS